VRKILCFLLLAWFSIGISCAQQQHLDVIADGGRGTEREAVALVRNAVAFLKANGKQKAMAEFNDAKGQFVHRDLHIVVFDQSGVMWADASNARLVGKTLLAAVDADGKHFVQEYIRLGNAEGRGWVNYRWSRPSDPRQHDLKMTYIEKVDDLVIGCAIYP